MISLKSKTRALLYATTWRRLTYWQNRIKRKLRSASKNLRNVFQSVIYLFLRLVHSRSWIIRIKRPSWSQNYTKKIQKMQTLLLVPFKSSMQRYLSWNEIKSNRISRVIINLNSSKSITIECKKCRKLSIKFMLNGTSYPTIGKALKSTRSKNTVDQSVDI